MLYLASAAWETKFWASISPPLPQTSQRSWPVSPRMLCTSRRRPCLGAIGSFWQGQCPVLGTSLTKGPSELGLSSTTDKQKEPAWRIEFEALGEQLVFENVKQGAIYYGEAKRQAALRWLSERGQITGPPRNADCSVWWAFFMAITAVLISIFGFLVALD
jgi:hypothetical protein